MSDSELWWSCAAKSLTKRTVLFVHCLGSSVKTWTLLTKCWESCWYDMCRPVVRGSLECRFSVKRAMHFFWCKAGIVCSQLYYCCSKSFFSLFNFLFDIYSVSWYHLCCAGSRDSRRFDWCQVVTTSPLWSLRPTCRLELPRRLCRVSRLHHPMPWRSPLPRNRHAASVQLGVCVWKGEGVETLPDSKYAWVKSMCVARKNDKSWYLPHELMGAECKCYTVYIFLTFFKWLLVALHCGWAVRHCTLPLEVGDNLVRVASPWHCTARWSVSALHHGHHVVFLLFLFLVE